MLERAIPVPSTDHPVLFDLRAQALTVTAEYISTAADNIAARFPEGCEVAAQAFVGRIANDISDEPLAASIRRQAIFAFRKRGVNI